MAKTSNEKKHIRKALESISIGNAAQLKRSIKEALFLKVRKALNIKEKEIAKSLIDSATSKGK